MKQKRIILIRNGEAEVNVDRYLFGWVPDYTIELTKLGRILAKEADWRQKEVVREETIKKLNIINLSYLNLEKRFKDCIFVLSKIAHGVRNRT